MAETKRQGRPADYPGMDLAQVTLRIPISALERAEREAKAAKISRRQLIELELWETLGIDTNRAATAA